MAIQIALGQTLAAFFLTDASLPASAEDSINKKGQAEFPPQFKRVKAPPLAGGIGYLNPDKTITLDLLAGRFVLLDFWTFCCINCMHILPHLEELEKQFSDSLAVVGIHSAKFENEKDTSNIEKAIARYGIKHPVINDADFKIWDAYEVQAWPTLVLIDPEGYIVGVYSGEGHTPEIAATIEKLTPIYKARGSFKPKRIQPEAQSKAKENLQYPGKVALTTTAKKLVVSSTGANRILIVALDENNNNGRVEKIIGSGEAAFKDGSLEKCAFNHPQGICFDQDNEDIVYVADTLNHAIRVINLKENKVTTLCGNGHEAGYGAAGGSFKDAVLNSPWDLTMLDHELYVAMAGSHQIWKSAMSAKEIAPLAGSGREDIIDGTFKSAALAQPSGITAEKNSAAVGHGENKARTKLYVADAEDSGLRQIDLQNKTVSTLIGKGLFVFGDVDGSLAQARLQHPLAVCAAGDKLYIADSYNHKIKCLDLLTKTISTVAGSGKSGNVDGQAEHAQFAEPGGLAFSRDKIYVADTNNSAIRVITLSAKGLASTDTLKLVW